MNEETQRRRAIAQRIGPAYAASPKVSAVMLAGSVARDTADRFSDIEIDVFWNDVPSDEERLAPIHALGARLLYVEADDNEWADGFLIDGVKVDTSQFRVTTMEQWLADAVERADTDLEKQLLIAAVQHGLPLHGHEFFEQWRATAATYPDALVYAMVARHLSFRPRFLLDMLAERDDALFLHQCLVGVQTQLMGVLLGLNRCYLAHPHHKWLSWQLAQMPMLPHDFEQRLRRILRDAPRPAVDETHRLIEEVFALVERHLPEFDTAPARAEFNDKRNGEG